jgi:transcriptional regulator with XRE-family HTH domain
MGELEIFALRLKQMREKMQMTQKEFSEFLGVKQQTLSGYERGTAKPPLDIAKNISKKCNVSLDWLCGLSDRENPDEKVKKYSDIVALLLKLNTGIGIELSTTESKDDYTCNTSVLTFDDDVLFDFINEWEKMRTLRTSTTIDDDVYALWIEKTLIKYNFPIDTNYFEKREKRFLDYKKKKYPLLY